MRKREQLDAQIKFILHTDKLVIPTLTITRLQYFPTPRIWEGIKPGMERNGTEWNRTRSDVQYGHGCWTRGQKVALIRTVCLCVRTLILHSVTATKTGQAPAESHVKHIKLLR